jgi:serine/threonine protein kinase
MKPLAQNSLIQNRYLIVHLIGKGGMGEVYLAVDQRLGSAVALKRTFFAGDENLRAAFEREAKILARVRHPVLPKVSDHFGEGEEQYLVMEHISGDDLSKRLEIAQKPFPISWVMFWADQLLDALSYLHAHEPPIIHRDIKPQNLKLTDENHIILLDFGLSKNTGNVAPSGDSSGSTAGSIVGYTPHYAPMEQIRGIGTSPRSDLYSLSATLYQLMTNEVPADALSRADCLLNGMEDPLKPPHEINNEITPAISEIIMKGMEVSQDKRYGDAREMQKVLRKAFNKMQSSMSADTIAFNASDIAGSNAGDPFKSEPVIDNSIQSTDFDKSLGGTYNTNFTKEEPSSAPSYDQTMQAGGMDTSGEGDGVRQADVKTEVFLAGSTPFVVPDEIAPVEPAADISAETPSAPPAQTDYYSADDMNSMTGGTSGDTGGDAGFSPDATVPLINLQNDIPSENSEVYASATGLEQPDEPAYEEEGSAAAASASVSSPSVAPKPKKKSGGKTFAIVAGLFVLLLLVAGAVGAGLYAYVNYPEMFGAAEETPSPTEEMTPTPTPEPSPTEEEVFDTNTNSNSDNSNIDDTNSNSDIQVVEPTPVPDDTKPTTQKTPVVRRTPVQRPQRTPAPPKKTPRPGPTIYQ